MNTKLSQITLLISLIALVSNCPDEDKCLLCNTKEGKCEACEDSFVQHNTGKCNSVIVDKIPNCKRYESENAKILCIECAIGYIFSDDFKNCIKCEVQNCALCSIDQICLACFDNRRLSKNQCGYFFQKCNLDNCNVCAMQGEREYCHECSNGFALDLDNNLEGCIEAPDNCKWASNKKKKECYLCKFGFHIGSNGNCVPNLSEPKRFWSFV